jgi:signal transduction histidine kinase
MFSSLRLRLFAGILGGVTVLLAAGAAATYFQIRRWLYAEFDRGLAQRASALASFIEEDEGLVEVGWYERDPQPPGHEPGATFFELSVYRGKSLLASEELAGSGLPRLGAVGQGLAFGSAELPGGKPGRAAGLVFSARDRAETSAPTNGRGEGDGTPSPEEAAEAARGVPEVVLQMVVARVDSVAGILARVGRLLSVLWAACSVLAALVTWMVVSRALRPMGVLGCQIRQLQDTVAGQRVDVPGLPRELEPVAAELNRLLERVEGALVRERNLTSNAAHELRTPIAGLLTTLEVMLGKDRDPDEYRDAGVECFEIAKRMHWLVNNLLSLSRIEAGKVQLEHRTVALAEALREWWAPFDMRARGRGLSVVWEIDAGARVETDPDFLRVVLTNLFDNAVSYVPPGGKVLVRADARGHITVGNDAVDVSEAVARQALAPFWRGSEARDGTGVHAGLGLSLSEKIVSLLGGRLRAMAGEPADWFEVRLDWATPGEASA